MASLNDLTYSINILASKHLELSDRVDALEADLREATSTPHEIPVDDLPILPTLQPLNTTKSKTHILKISIALSALSIASSVIGGLVVYYFLTSTLIVV